MTATVGVNYSFTPTASDTSGTTITFSISGLPAWATFNKSTGQLSGTPAAADVGTDPGIVIGASDGATTSAALPAYTITVSAPATCPPGDTGVPPNCMLAPPPPDVVTISGTASTAATVGVAYGFQPTVTDSNASATLTFSATALPDWLVINPATGDVSGTPGAGDIGVDAGITVTVTDSTGGSASLPTFTVNVSPPPPPPPSAPLMWTLNFAGATLYGQVNVADPTGALSPVTMTYGCCSGGGNGLAYLNTIAINSAYCAQVNSCSTPLQDILFFNVGPVPGAVLLYERMAIGTPSGAGATLASCTVTSFTAPPTTIVAGTSGVLAIEDCGSAGALTLSWAVTVYSPTQLLFTETWSGPLTSATGLIPYGLTVITTSLSFVISESGDVEPSLVAASQMVNGVLVQFAPTPPAQ
jgi:hypothetical protein